MFNPVLSLILGIGIPTSIKARACAWCAKPFYQVGYTVIINFDMAYVKSDNIFVKRLCTWEVIVSSTRKAVSPPCDDQAGAVSFNPSSEPPVDL